MEINIINEKPSVVNQYLAQLRDVDVQNDRLRFRRNLERIGEIMAYEISKESEYVQVSRKSPLSEFSSLEIKSRPYIIGILRASLPFIQGFLNMFDESDCGFVGAYRKHSQGDEFDISLDYLATDSLEGKNVIIADPMLATGKSLVDTVGLLSQQGQPKSIQLASVIASKDGLNYIERALGQMNVTLWTAVVDDKLNDRYYIVPGLGDAGDLAFGNKL
ncbi:MAG: uracil phosphoribosyltransferase [Bacteroidota bacterium]